MTKEAMATLLNGRPMGDEITSSEEEIAKEHGLFVIYGYSDDSVEIRGVESEEIGAYDGTTFRLGAGGILKDWDDIDSTDIDECRKFFTLEATLEATGKQIEAVWNDEGKPCWTYKTDVPHATFDILEDGEVFCRGIVIDSKDLK